MLLHLSTVTFLGVLDTYAIMFGSIIQSSTSAAQHSRKGLSIVKSEVATNVERWVLFTFTGGHRIYHRQLWKFLRLSKGIK